MKKVFFAFALLATAWMVSCTKEINQDEMAVLTDGTRGTLIVQASKQAATRALELKDGYIDAFWAEDDSVEVYSTRTGNFLGYLSPSAFGDNRTTLEGTVDINEVEVGDLLWLLFHGKGDMSYSHQDGTLEGIARRHDVAGTSVRVKTKDDSRVTTEEASFQNLQAIVKFKLRNENGDPMDVRFLSISARSILSKMTSCGGSSFDIEYGAVTVTPSAPTDELFVSLCLEGYSSWCSYYLCAQGDDGHYYECLKEDVDFSNGMYYEGTVKMKRVRYTVVGCSGPLGASEDDPLFGKTWDYRVTANDMVAEDAVFKKSYPGISKGTIVYLKVVKNRSWELAWPEQDNLIVTAWEDGTLNVEFDPRTEDLYAEMDYGGKEYETEPVYTVCGDNASVFGDSWRIVTPENDMALQDEYSYVYTKTYTGLTPGELRFRIVEDREWDYVHPHMDYDPYYVSIPSFGNLTIYFHPSNGEITTSFEATAAPDADYYLSGSFNFWTLSDDYLMTKQDDGTYTYAVEFMAADPYVQFKVVMDKDWNVSWPEYNYEVAVPGSGILTVVFNPNTGEITTSFVEQALNITYTVAGSTNGTAAGESDILFGVAWDPALAANDMQYLEQGGYYYKEYTVVEPGRVAFKVVKNHSWDMSWPSENYNMDLLGPGTLMVAYAPGYGVEAMMQYTQDNYSLTGDIWDWEISVDRVMSLLPDGTYSVRVTIDQPGDHSFMVVKNGRGGVTSMDIQFESACTVDILYNPDTGEMSYNIAA
jgi:hypothetical protein